MPDSFCYVLRSADGRRTYAGYTVDPERRLRQHNGELRGGAWSTSALKGTWSFAFVVHSEGFDKHLALSFEWHLKHLPGARVHRRQKWKKPEALRGMALRIACLRNAMGLPKFAGCVPTLAVYVAPDLVDEVWAATSDLGLCVMPLDEDAPWHEPFPNLFRASGPQKLHQKTDSSCSDREPTECHKGALKR